MTMIIKSTYKELDNLLKEGLKPKDLIYIMGRSNKTTDFILGLAKNIALKEKILVAIFSFKYPKQTLTQRLISLDSGIPLEKIKKAKLNNQEWPKFTQSAGRLSEAPIYIDKLSKISIQGLYRKISFLKQKNNIKLIILILTPSLKELKTNTEPDREKFSF